MRSSWILLFVLACDGSTPPAPTRCLEPPPRKGEAVATVGSVTITAGQLEEALRGPSGSAPPREYSQAEVRQFVEDQVRLELLAQAALERGLDRDPDVVSAARKLMVKKLLERDLAQVLPAEQGKRGVAFDRYLGELRARFPVQLHEESLHKLGAKLASPSAPPPGSAP